MQQLKIVGPYRLDAQAKVRLELSAETLAKLLNSGLVSVNNFRCLDQGTKQCVWKLLLESLDHSSPQCAELYSKTCCQQKNLKSNKPLRQLRVDNLGLPVWEIEDNVAPGFNSAGTRF